MNFDFAKKTNTLIVLLGPTGIGKTELSIRLAEKLNTEIISADSRQLYESLRIGTAAPTAEQLATVKHHFVGTLALSDYYSAAQFETDVIAFLDTFFQHNETAIITGGSMMYIDAICKGIDNLPTIDTDLRNKIYAQYETEGLDPIRHQLRILDPIYYDQVDLKNPKRVIHALEICLMTGKPYSSLRTNQKKERPFHILKIGLQRNREELYERINHRVDEMMNNGLLNESLLLHPYKSLNALNTVGYKELFQHIEGKISLDEAVDKIKQNTRIYSRKQTTWFKRDTEINWFHPTEVVQIENCIDCFLKLNATKDLD